MYEVVKNYCSNTNRNRFDLKVIEQPLYMEQFFQYIEIGWRKLIYG